MVSDLSSTKPQPLLAARLASSLRLYIARLRCISSSAQSLVVCHKGAKLEALAFLDLLGFSQMVSTNSGRAKKVLHDFYNISFRIIKRKQQVQGSLFSDSLLAYSTDPALLINIVTEIYRECLRKNDSYEFDLSKYFLLPRGGVSFSNSNYEFGRSNIF